MLSDLKVSVELPVYQCHKKVRAIKIAEIHPGRIDGKGSGATLVTMDGTHVVCVGEHYDHKHRPTAGGYYVLYEDGYESFSPAEAFESGYTLIACQPLSVGETFQIEGDHTQYGVAAVIESEEGGEVAAGI
jgi:hypothetical protein